jgi:hypothetical protein
MNWIFSAFLTASVLHMGEEYFFPGGFMDVMRRFNPRFAPFVTTPMAVVVNGLQLLLCVLAIVVGSEALVFSMSLAGLLFINSLMHIGASIRAKGYAPGAVTSVLLYLPLSTYAYRAFIRSGQLTLNEALFTGLLGALYQAVPISYFALSSVLRRTHG